MQSAWFGVLCGFIGLFVGFTFGLVWLKSRNRLLASADLLQPEVPPAATQILEQLDFFAVVLDKSFSVVFANEAAISHETIPAEFVSGEQFIDQAKSVMRSGVEITQQPDDSESDGIWMHMFKLSGDFIIVLADDRGEEQRLNAMRRDFIANMSHELKTPVASIGLLAEAIIEAADDSERVSGFAATMQKQSKRLADLTNDIILLSEAQSEPSLEELEEVDIAELVTLEVAAHSDYAQQRGVRMVFELKSDEPFTTIGRPSGVRTAIANLLSNAIKHSPSESRVGVLVERKVDSVILQVTDHGSGIEPEDSERIFERFYRVDNARTREEGGTGLGLSIVRHTMLAVGGSVAVWSKPGVGSTFTLTFPALGSGNTADKILERKHKKRKKTLK